MFKFTKKDVDSYIESKKFAWSKSTLNSEVARLRANLDVINSGPSELVKKLTDSNKYSIKTLFIRAGELESFCNSGDTYKSFLKDNAQLFKNAYTRKEVAVTFEQAAKAIDKIASAAVKKVAFSMLTSGLRSREALSYDGSGSVLGKGGKLRDVFISADLAQHNVSYTKLYRELKKVGLAPHDLRKLAATRLVEAGFREADLLAVMGWSNIQTASLYLQPKNKQELQAKVSQALLIKEM